MEWNLCASSIRGLRAGKENKVFVCAAKRDVGPCAPEEACGWCKAISKEAMAVEACALEKPDGTEEVCGRMVQGHLKKSRE